MKQIKYIILFFLSFATLYSQNIVSYEYWINNDYNNKITKSISAPSKIAEIKENLDIPSAKVGSNLLHIRFKDSNGKFSSTLSSFFFQTGKSNEETAKMAELEYWINNDFANKRKLPFSDDGAISTLIDLKDLPNGSYLIHFRFKDNSGVYSQPIAQFVFKAGEGNQSEDYLITSYRYWLDEDLQNVKVINFDKPEELLNFSAVIDLPPNQVDAVHFQFKDISGMWSSVETRAFTPEADFEVFSTINTFTFQNTSVFAKEFQWDFGDNSAKATTHSPSHTYKLPGEYKVTLIATNKLGKDTLTKLVTAKGIREVVSNTAGNTGDATILVYGGGLRSGSKVFLEDASGNRIEANPVLHTYMDALSATFDLRDKAIGKYNVIVEKDADVLSLNNAFEIVQGTEPEPYAFINGRDRVLFNRWQTYSLDFGNRGNVDASGVPLILVFSEPVNFEIEFPELTLNNNTELKKHKNYNEFKDLPDFFPIDNLFGDEFKGRVYALYIPTIAANSSNSMNFKVKAGANISMHAWVTDPYFHSPMDIKVSSCVFLAITKLVKDKLVDLAFEEMPIAGCIHGIYSQYLEPYFYESLEFPADPSYTNREQSWSDKMFSWGNSALDLTFTIFNCVKDFVPVLKAYSVACKVVGILNDIRGGYLKSKECNDKYKKIEPQSKDVRAVSSFDPNEMVGPQGSTEAHYTLNNRNYNYTIYFENLKTASAAAQEVIIRDTLDKNKFDFSTFSFETIKFGDRELTPSPGLKEFTLDAKHNSLDECTIRLNGKFDEKTGIIMWQFITLDKSTMELSEDPDSGFLPPNVNSPEGEGNVKFSIALKNNLPNNEEITNQATIYFDLNEPIITNTYSNKIDIIPPTSKLTNIYTTHKENLYRITNVSNDDQSKVKRLVIYAQTNNSNEYFPLMNTTADNFYFQGEKDSVYHFFSQAIDEAGNIEVAKSNYEVSTSKVSVSDFDIAKFDFTVSPNPITNNNMEINFNAGDGAKIEIMIFDINGRNVFSESMGTKSGNFKNDFYLHGISNGKYIIQTKFNDVKIAKILNVVK